VYKEKRKKRDKEIERQKKRKEKRKKRRRERKEREKVTCVLWLVPACCTHDLAGWLLLCCVKRIVAADDPWCRCEK